LPGLRSIPWQGSKKGSARQKNHEGKKTTVKTAKDPRHIRRERAIKALFSYTFKKGRRQNAWAEKIIAKKEQIDKIISQSAPEWPVAQINRIDLAILRLAIYELVIKVKEPPKVVIDEAVELAKKYGSEKSPGFVNGVLGTVYKEITTKKGPGEKSKTA
jgi:N utilization substance protein B